MTHAELTAAGVEVGADVHAQLAQYVALLLDENQRLNLTSVREAEQAWITHICDSLALLPLMRACQPQRALDLGTGGGLPGIPLACACPTTEFTLLDATRKKVAAVERIAAGLELENVRLAWGRAEALAHDVVYRERFDAVTARAVADLPVLIECCAGFVRPGGVCWCFKTREEAASGESAARACELEYVEARPYRLPAVDAERVILIYRKVGALRAELPRQAGRAKKRPL